MRVVGKTTALPVGSTSLRFFLKGFKKIVMGTDRFNHVLKGDLGFSPYPFNITKNFPGIFFDVFDFVQNAGAMFFWIKKRKRKGRTYLRNQKCNIDLLFINILQHIEMGGLKKRLKNNLK